MMDTGKGKLEMADNEQALEALKKQYPQHRGWFKVGEIVELKGSRFRVKAVKPTELRLKLLPKES